MPFDENQLYKALVCDICEKEYPEYENLVIFVHNLLNPLVKKWCYNDLVLRGGLHAEDVMQEIQIRVIKKCENYFFKPINGKTDKTCEEFKAWCIKVAKNYFITYCVKQKNRKEVELDLSINVEEEQFFIEDSTLVKQERTDERRRDLQKCFVVVLDLKSKPHIVLTWLSVSLFMIDYDVSKIESTHLLVKKFSELTLAEMFNIVIGLIEKIEWLQIEIKQIEKQRQKLETLDNMTGKKIGDMKYSDFYMNKGPEMSISDWINRVNSQIRKHINVD